MRRHNKPMELERIAWLAAVVISLVVAVTLFMEGYEGYGALAIVIALSASVNLPRKRSE